MAKLTIEQQLNKIDKSGDCWIWKGGLSDYGFGVFGFGGKTKYPHRIMWEKANGMSARGFVLKHTCGNNACCNHKHLYVQDKGK